MVQASPFPSMSVRRLLWLDVVFDKGPVNDYFGSNGSNMGFESTATGEKKLVHQLVMVIKEAVSLLKQKSEGE